jgi:hypothetical protein
MPECKLGRAACKSHACESATKDVMTNLKSHDILHLTMILTLEMRIPCNQNTI